jgi:hypothetical protein
MIGFSRSILLKKTKYKLAHLQTFSIVFHSFMYKLMGLKAYFYHIGSPQK